MAENAGDPLGATPQDTSPATGSPPETGATPEDGNEPISVESYRRLQAEAKRHRLAAKDAADRLAALEGEKLTDAERAAKRLKELEDENLFLAAQARMAEVKAIAASEGARYPDAVARLVDDGDEDIGKAVRRLKREMPELFLVRGTAGTANGSASGPLPPADSGMAVDAFIRSRAGR